MKTDTYKVISDHRIMEEQDNKLFSHYLQQKKTNHILHLLLSVITVGFWIPVWMYISYSVSQHNANIGKPPRKPYVLYGLAIVVMALALVLSL